MRFFFVVVFLLPFAAILGAGCGAPKRVATFTCDDPGPLVVAGEETGFVFCTHGAVHRAKILACPSKLPRVTKCPARPALDSPTCVLDTDCAGGAHAFCTIPRGGVDCECAQGCVRDEECPPGDICLCGDPVGACVPATCTADADCKNGHLCVEVHRDQVCGPAFACQSATDECSSDEDCSRNELCINTVAGNACEVGNCSF